ncbi:hypothetical protein BH11ACT8_BH11ACT8_09250 [soil metagenome]
MTTSTLPGAESTGRQRVVVGLVTLYAAFGLYAVVFLWGDPEGAVRLAPAALVVAACASTVWVWRAGPGHAAPLRVSALVVAVGVLTTFGTGLPGVRTILVVLTIVVCVAASVAWSHWADARR